MRNTTLTALQALALLNDPFMLQQAEFFAGRVYHNTRHSVDASFRPTGDLGLGLFVNWGASIDFTNERKADFVTFGPSAEVNIGRRIRGEVSWVRQTFRTVEGRRIFTVDLPQARLRHQLAQMLEVILPQVRIRVLLNRDRRRGMRAVQPHHPGLNAVDQLLDLARDIDHLLSLPRLHRDRAHRFDLACRHHFRYEVPPMQHIPHRAPWLLVDRKEHGIALGGALEVWLVINEQQH